MGLKGGQFCKGELASMGPWAPLPALRDDWQPLASFLPISAPYPTYPCNTDRSSMASVLEEG